MRGSKSPRLGLELTGACEPVDVLLGLLDARTPFCGNPCLGSLVSKAYVHTDIPNICMYSVPRYLRYQYQARSGSLARRRPREEA